MQIDGKEIPVHVIKTQYEQYVEVYETEPGRFVDLSTGIVWTQMPHTHCSWCLAPGMCPEIRWTSATMHATSEAQS